MPDDSRVKTKRVLWDSHLDEMIEETWGRKWAFQQSGDYYSNDSFVSADVYDDSDPEFLEAALAKIEEWRNSPPARSPGRDADETVHMYLEEFLVGLCHAGKLEPGPISIHVWW